MNTNPKPPIREPLEDNEEPLDDGDDFLDDEDEEDDQEFSDCDDVDRCTHPLGHSWAYTGTQYGGDDERYGGEGRCYCEYCGADGDG